MSTIPIIIFQPCCAPGDTSIIFTGTQAQLGVIGGSVYVYIGSLVVPSNDSAPWNMLIPGQCYYISYATVPVNLGYAVLPATVNASQFSNSTPYFNQGDPKTCRSQYCIDACLPPDVEEWSNRYLIFTPCCEPSTPVYFRINNTLQDQFNNIALADRPGNGVATYTGAISGNNFPTTNYDGTPGTPLIQGLCYSITLGSAGVGQLIDNSTDYYNLAVFPPNIPGNYIYHSSSVPPISTDCNDFTEECPCSTSCYRLWSCNGSTPLFTTNTDLSAYIGQNIVVSSIDPNDNIDSLCVYVEQLLNTNCLGAIEVIYEEPCVCPCTCYSITGDIKSILYVDCNNETVFLGPLGVSTTTICSRVYPIVFSNIQEIPIVINNGDCIEQTIFNPETCEEETSFVCEPQCYVLIDCTDQTNVIYSTSTSLAQPAILGQVVTIAGFTECWEVLIAENCDCPINVTVLQVHECCEACLPNINYKLTNCDNPNIYVYTSSDLSLYVDKVIRRVDCPEECWIVSEIFGNIPTDISISILEDYDDCEKCKRIYYLLEDCLGLQNDIITYTDLSDYVNNVIILDWCPETCWEVSETIENEGAGEISDILTNFENCTSCLTNASCICSTIKNYNAISQIYKYLDCYGILQSITLQPNQKSDRLCLIRWYATEPCDELIVTITSSTGIVSNITVYQNSINHPGPVTINNKPTWKDVNNNLYIYYDGTKWILSKNFNPLILPSIYTTIGYINCNGDCDCPTGTWQQSSSIPNQDFYVTTELKYTIEYFGNCINGVCPPKKNKQKSITPGYNTPGCEAWKYEEISCKAADAMYKQVLELRYGISNCCSNEDEKYIVQKELIDLAALYDSAYPCSTNSCKCGCLISTNCSCN